MNSQMVSLSGFIFLAISISSSSPELFPFNQSSSLLFSARLPFPLLVTSLGRARAKRYFWPLPSQHPILHSATPRATDCTFPLRLVVRVILSFPMEIFHWQNWILENDFFSLLEFSILHFMSNQFKLEEFVHFCRAGHESLSYICFAFSLCGPSIPVSLILIGEEARIDE